MKVKMFNLMDVLFSTFSVLSAGMLGNALLAEHLPSISEKATWLNKWVIKGLTAPQSLADALLGSFPSANLLVILIMSSLLEYSLILFTPFVQQIILKESMRDGSVDPSVINELIRRNPRKVLLFKFRLLKRVSLKLALKCGVFFGVGMLACFLAWGGALLANSDMNGFIQTTAVVLGTFALVFVYSFLADALTLYAEEGGDPLDFI